MISSLTTLKGLEVTEWVPPSFPLLHRQIYSNKQSHPHLYALPGGAISLRKCKEGGDNNIFVVGRMDQMEYAHSSPVFGDELEVRSFVELKYQVSSLLSRTQRPDITSFYLFIVSRMYALFSTNNCGEKMSYLSKDPYQCIQLVCTEPEMKSLRAHTLTPTFYLHAFQPKRTKNRSQCRVGYKT